MADPYETLGMVRNPDGTFTRNPSFVLPTTEATLDSSSPVLSKDIQINPSKNTWARIFLPNLSPPPAATKLPLIIYHHGGGFVFKITPSTTPIHNFCLNIAASLPAIVVSVDYRPAPEHRLPAAYDDAMEALQWIRSRSRSSEDDCWLKKHADFSNCFLMGTSAGANAVFHAGHRAAEMVDELDPLRIQGLILNQPFFGGVQRTGPELRLVDDPVVPLRLCGVMWDLCLPIGADRDHEYCNPTVEGRLNGFERIKALGWKVLVNGCDGDPFFDRQKEVAKLMEESGVNVVSKFVSGGSHGVEIFDIAWAKRLFSIMKECVSSTEV